ncbi:MAG TPA: SRPBCC domain-containing protein [Candidatus Angelobacter sp.]
MSTAIATPSGVENLVLNLTNETHVRASLEDTFAALLEQLGPGADTPEGNAMPMKLELWPGGRWFRDLGDNNGHLWGHVQAVKRPTLLEITGPLFLSYAVVNNVQYRLTKVEGGTLIQFHHFALGAIPDDYREGINKGWTHIAERIRARAEKK